MNTRQHQTTDHVGILPKLGAHAYGEASTLDNGRDWFLPSLAVTIFLVLILCGNYVGNGPKLYDHDPFDQHTRQAAAWLKGSVEIGNTPWLEIATFEGKHFNSFPPTPTLIELPLYLLFGQSTPNRLALILFLGLCVFFQVQACLRYGLSRTLAVVLPIWFAAGTNIFSSSTNGGIWGQGQVYGYFFASLGFLCVMRKTPAWILGPGLGYVLLSLAVGCRPFYLCMFPAFLCIERAERLKSTLLPLRWQFFRASLALSPYLGWMAWYNYQRFHAPWEFGHRYLPWSLQLADGVFSVRYLLRNSYHAFLHLPHLTDGSKFLSFDGRGTAFWINNVILLIGLAGLVRTKLLSPIERSLLLATAAVIWFLLLLHESNGWYQFGYRYCIDIMPLAFIGCLYSYKRCPVWMTALFAASLAVNMYGVFWFTHP